jgi:hypothetical protein
LNTCHIRYSYYQWNAKIKLLLRVRLAFVKTFITFISGHFLREPDPGGQEKHLRLQH